MKRELKYLAFTAIFLMFIINSATFSQGSITEGNETRPGLVINRFGLFDSDEILEITLKFDITRFMAEKPQEEYLDASIICNFSESDSISSKIRIRARGNYRYKNCQFPPVRLNFRDLSSGYSDLDSLKNVKLVTHCYDSAIYQNYLMGEYLVYRLFNFVTDYSFRVRFLKINYVDTGNTGSEMVQYAYMIEPLSMLLFRTGTTELEEVVLEYNDIEDKMIDRIALFQFLIGNSDWYLPMTHNFKIIRESGQSHDDVMAIPYDFDYSGFVNTHYAHPREDLGLEVIRDRYYLGPCRSEAEIRDLLDEFLNYREDFIDEIRNFSYLDGSVKRELVKYVKSFYSMYKKDVLLKQILNNCIDKN